MEFVIRPGDQQLIFKSVAIELSDTNFAKACRGGYKGRVLTQLGVGTNVTVPTIASMESFEKLRQVRFDHFPIYSGHRARVKSVTCSIQTALKMM